MSSSAAELVQWPLEPGVEIPICPENESDTAHIEVDLMPRDDDDFQTAVAREVRLQMREQTNAFSGRSVDTLRRDIGIFAILLAMMVQTGAAFYWAGGVSRTQESNKETMVQMQQEQAYTRAQLQLIDGQLKLIQGKQEVDMKRK
jgi:hypothetical protein